MTRARIFDAGRRVSICLVGVSRTSERGQARIEMEGGKGVDIIQPAVLKLHNALGTLFSSLNILKLLLVGVDHVGPIIVPSNFMISHWLFFPSTGDCASKSKYE